MLGLRCLQMYNIFCYIFSDVNIITKVDKYDHCIVLQLHIEHPSLSYTFIIFMRRNV